MRRALVLVLALGTSCRTPTAPELLGPCSITMHIPPFRTTLCYTQCPRSAETFARESAFTFAWETTCG